MIPFALPLNFFNFDLSSDFEWQSKFRIFWTFLISRPDATYQYFMHFGHFVSPANGIWSILFWAMQNGGLIRFFDWSTDKKFTHYIEKAPECHFWHLLSSRIKENMNKFQVFFLNICFVWILSRLCLDLRQQRWNLIFGKETFHWMRIFLAFCLLVNNFVFGCFFRLLK